MAAPSHDTLIKPSSNMLQFAITLVSVIGKYKKSTEPDSAAEMITIMTL